LGGRNPSKKEKGEENFPFLGEFRFKNPGKNGFCYPNSAKKKYLRRGTTKKEKTNPIQRKSHKEMIFHQR